MSTKRVIFTIDNFPFDKLRVGNKKENSKKSDFSSVHQFSKIETSPGVLEDYGIDNPATTSDAVSYYLPKGAENKPSLYLHPILHPHWATKTSTGERQTTPTGLKIEAFWEKFNEAWTRECLLLSEGDRIFMMGMPFAKVNENTIFLAPVAKHPNHSDKHPLLPGQPDEDKPKTIHMAVWTQDVTTRAVTDNKKKFANPNTTANSGSSDFMIPDTNVAVLASIYDTRSQKKGNTNKRDHNATNAAASGEKITKWEDFKQFTYNAEGHPNANSTNGTLLAKTTILGPSANWNLKNPGPATLMIKVCQLSVMHYSERNYAKGLSTDRLQQLEKEKQEAMAELGIVSSDDEEEEQVQQQQQQEEEVEFENEFQRVNYLAQKECSSQITVMQDLYRSLLDKKVNEKNEKALQTINQQIKIYEGKIQKKQDELDELQQEMVNMLEENYEGNNAMEEENAFENDSAEEPTPATKKARLTKG